MLKLNQMTIAALAAASISSTASADPINLYGRLDLSLQSADEQGVSQTEIISNASRFGVRGDYQISDSLEAFYQLEWQIDVADNANSSANHIKARNQFVGLRGDFGSVQIGRFDTPFKRAQMKFDLFSDWEGDMKRILNGEVRADSVIQYSTPGLLDDALRFNIALLPGENSAPGQNGLADGISASVEYGSGPFSLALAMDSEVEGIGVDSMRLVGQYRWDAFRFAAIMQTVDAGPGLDGEGFGASIAYVNGANTFKLQVMDSDTFVSGVGGDWEDYLSVGMDHRLGDNTKLYGYYTVGTDGISGLDDRYLGFGIRLDF